MPYPLDIYVGYDPREAVAYHVFCESVIRHASRPVAFHPLHRGLLHNFDGQRDGTNAFIFSRYLVPYLQNFKGTALFCDGDMVVTDDIAKLFAEWDNWSAVQIVQHDYQTRNPRKYIGTPLENDNLDYPRKNWSSVMLWNCGHYANRILTPDFVAESPGSLLHRFEWLRPEQIGRLSPEWNVLVREQDMGDPKLLHYTCGVPGIPHYSGDGAEWHRALLSALSILSVDPAEMVERAKQWRS